MLDTISKVEAWLAIAADRYAERTGAVIQARREAIDEADRNLRSHELAAPAFVPLDVVLAKRARQFAALSSQASLVDLWTAQLLHRPYVAERSACSQRCSCDGPLMPAAATAAVDRVQRLETAVTERMLNTYRTITRTNTGRLIDVVV